jgi:hypothetical protein
MSKLSLYRVNWIFQPVGFWKGGLLSLVDGMVNPSKKQKSIQQSEER